MLPVHCCACFLLYFMTAFTSAARLSEGSTCNENAKERIDSEFIYELLIGLVQEQLQLEGRSLECIPSTTAEQFQQGDPTWALWVGAWQSNLKISLPKWDIDVALYVVMIWSKPEQLVQILRQLSVSRTSANADENLTEIFDVAKGNWKANH